jgi:hypothetical protein
LRSPRLNQPRQLSDINRSSILEVASHLAERIGETLWGCGHYSPTLARAFLLAVFVGGRREEHARQSASTEFGGVHSSGVKELLKELTEAAPRLRRSLKHADHVGQLDPQPRHEGNAFNCWRPARGALVHPPTAAD